ncbi:hypothetical protein [Helicobacter sp. MIT 01-3238]|uniref:hypothetical protein n=1 Tax=Helicobacter sp. MIT 01-3238 TaxID=398627 RepID=UPI0015F14450|nr:hypothetical protein [Helicobacter sp. MIT 01-3238]
MSCHDFASQNLAMTARRITKETSLRLFCHESLCDSRNDGDTFPLTRLYSPDECEV